MLLERLLVNGRLLIVKFGESEVTYLSAIFSLCPGRRGSHIVQESTIPSLPFPALSSAVPVRHSILESLDSPS